MKKNLLKKKVALYEQAILNIYLAMTSIRRWGNPSSISAFKKLTDIVKPPSRD